MTPLAAQLLAVFALAATPVESPECGCAQQSCAPSLPPPAPDPLRAIAFHFDGQRVTGIEIALASPVQRIDDLRPSAQLVELRLADGARPPSREDLDPLPDRVRRSFVVEGYARSRMPPAAVEWTLTLRKGLRFASGERLEEDVVASFVPAEYRSGWIPEAPPQPAPPPPEVAPAGRGCRAGGQLGDLGPLFAIALATGAGRRRRGRFRGRTDAGATLRRSWGRAHYPRPADRADLAPHLPKGGADGGHQEG